MIAIDMNMPRGCKQCLFLREFDINEFSSCMPDDPPYVYSCMLKSFLKVSDKRGKPLRMRPKDCPLIEIKKENKDEM